MESINPNDIITLDVNTISYLTLKNGNMVMLDDTVPQKTNKENKNNSEYNAFSSDTLKSPSKEIKLEISSPLEISFEGKLDSNKYKSNFKLGTEIINNTNFSFFGTKTNINHNDNIGKENLFNINNVNYNIDKNDINSQKDILKLGNINNFNNKNNEISNSRRHSIKESEIKPITNIKTSNENEVDFTKIDKLDFNQSNANTNASIPLMNFTNNLDNKSGTNQFNRRKSHASRGYGGPGRKNRISVNAVCSLNIKAEEKFKINLINQFNDIVDKLNAEREKKPAYEIIGSDRENKDIKYYEFYKNKTQNNIMKNMETLNQNFMDTNNDFKKGTVKNINTLNNYNKRKSIEFNGFNKNFGLLNKNLNENYGKSPAKYSSNNKMKNFRNKIKKYSSELVFPSNKIIHI